MKIEDLIPAKLTVQTSIGPLHVRNARTSDWKHFESDDDKELGMAAVQYLCSRNEDKTDSEPLAETDLKALTETDIQKVAPAISKQSFWGELLPGAGLRELGLAMKEAKEKLRKLNDKMFENIRQSINLNYSFLEEGTLGKLQEQMAEIGSIRNSIYNNTFQQAALDALKPVGSTVKAGFSIPRGFENIDIGKRELEMPWDTHRSHASALPEVFKPPRFEETAMGRATLQSAENSREVAMKMEALVNLITGLNQTMIMEILPAWARQVEEEQKGATIALQQTASGLKWTKWAVIVSVVVTMLTTWWQISVATGFDRENTEQQKRHEALLDKQIAAQQKMLEQQTRDQAALREAIAALKETPPLAGPKK